MIDVKERFIIIFFDRSRDGRLARKILVGKSYNSPGKIHNTLEMVWSLNKNFPEISDCLLKLVMSSACSGSCLFKIKFQKFETINPLNFLVLQKVLYMVNLLSIKYIPSPMILPTKSANFKFNYQLTRRLQPSCNRLTPAYQQNYKHY